MASFLSYRRFIALLLLVSVFAQTFRNSFIVLDYYLHTGWYMQNCVYGERTVVEQCFGKCRIVKKIKEEQRKEDQGPLRKLSNGNEVVYFEQFNCPVPVAFFLNSHEQAILPVEAIRDISADCFRPPQAA